MKPWIGMRITYVEAQRLMAESLQSPLDKRFVVTRLVSSNEYILCFKDCPEDGSNANK